MAPTTKRAKPSARKNPASKSAKPKASKKTKKPVPSACVKVERKEKAPKADKPAKKPAPGTGPVAKLKERVRVIFSRETYDAHKEEIKAPLKALDLKWQWLGDGKGRYHKDGVNVFVQQSDAGADFSVRAGEAAVISRIKDAWSAFPQQDVAKVEEEEKKEEESEATRLWKLGEPQRRPGEPESFYLKRRAEWEALKP